MNKKIIFLWVIAFIFTIALLFYISQSYTDEEIKELYNKYPVLMIVGLITVIIVLSVASAYML